MSVEYVGFREQAEKSLDCNDPDESDFRNAVSRSYYCMYHAVMLLTGGSLGKHDSKGKEFKGGVHKKLSSYLSDNAAEKLGIDKDKTVRLGVLLKQMHSLRVIADYKLCQSVSSATAKMAIERSYEIEQSVKELIKTRR